MNFGTTNQDRAIVIGGSMAGLLAARVLSEHYKDVVIIERDDLSVEGQNRRGVPQGRHAHAILAGGLNVIEELFPGISDELVSRGAIPSDPLNDGRWFMEGNDLKRVPSGTCAIMLSRPLLEDGVRRRTRDIANVRILDDHAVRELITEGERVTGLTTDREAIAADLVVDASGRGSRAPKWLKSLGFNPPPEESVEVQLVYTTRIFRRHQCHMNGDSFVVVPPTPEGKRGGVALSKENDEWIVTLFGHFGNQAPSDLEGFIEYARTLPAPHIFELLQSAAPVGDAAVMHYPASVRRRYEKVDRSPDGFIVFGDAICSFNPVYGQGMSSAALQSNALLDSLRYGSADLAARFYRAAAKVIDNPWSIAVGTDLRMAETNGLRGPDVRLINWYMSKLHRRGHDNADAALAFIRVAQLLEPPTSLMRPGMALRVLISAVGRIVRSDTPRNEKATVDLRASGQWRSDGF